MTARTRKIMKLANQFLYVLSIAMLISGSFLSAIAQPVAAAAPTGSGSIWTLSTGCGPQQNINHYSAGNHVFINFSDFAAGTYNWSITPPSHGSTPVASGSFTVNSTGAGCFDAYTIGANDEGEYSVDFGGKNDNYQVCGPGLMFDGQKCVPVPAPSLSIVKSVDPAFNQWFPTAAGGTVHYLILVTNTGNVALTGVVVIDPGANALSCPATTLAVGAHMTCHAEHWVTQAEFDAGTYTNTATASSNEAAPASSSVTVNFTRSPALDVTKTQTTPGTYTVGQTIHYSIVVTNIGNVTLNNVTVTDISAIVGTCSPVNGSSLAPGAAMTCAATHVVLQSDIDSGAYLNTATGTSGQISDSASVRVTFTQNPSLTIAKSVVTPPPYAVGQVVNYSIVVTNNGNVTLHNVTVADPGTSPSCTPASGSTLAPAAVMTCTASHTVTQPQFDFGSYTNTATADSNETSPQTDSATISFVPGPGLSIEKTITSAGPYALGNTINFSILVTNTGNVTLGSVTVTDPTTVLGTCSPVNGSPLAPLGTMTCPASHVVTQPEIDAHSYTNTASASSTGPAFGPVTDAVTVDFVPAPSFSIAKVAAPGTYVLASSIPYTITLTNTGNVTLHNVVVSDPTAVIGTCSPVSGSNLAPTAVMTCPATHVVTQADMDLGSYMNTTTAVSNEAGPLSASATVTFTQSPNLSIVKSVTSVAPEGGYVLGNTLTYAILLTNTGNITLHNVTITDLNAVLGSCTPSVPAATLVVGSMITCAASHVILQADLDAGLFENTAVGNSTEAGPKQDLETVSFTKGPAISFEKKEVSQGPYFVGDTISYSLELTNIGNVSLHNVTIADPLAVIGTCAPAIPVASLLPLAKVTCAATHVVTAADITAGLTFMNTAVGDSDDTLPKNASVTASLAIKGCMDPNATNYNPKATVSDGSCTYPPNPTPNPTVVPTLPIPATGGEILIPVTGADLSNTLPGATLPRNLYFGGLSVFGVAMVLTGLRRKYHL